MVKLGLANLVTALICVLIPLGVRPLPLLASPDALPLALGPVTAVALAAVLLGGWRLLPAAAAGVAGAVLVLRPDAPALAAALAGVTLVAAGWATVYTRFAVDDRLADLVLTLRGVAALLALGAGLFALWQGTLATLAAIILDGAGRDHAAFEHALIAWTLPAGLSAAVLLPPAVLLAHRRSGPRGPHGLGWLGLVALGAAVATAFLMQAGPAGVDWAKAAPFLLLPALMALAAASAPHGVAGLAGAGAVALGLAVAGLSAWGPVETLADLGPVAVMVVALSASALPFGALMTERRAAMADLEAANDALEARVEARTAEARAGESRLRRILDSSPVAVCVTRPAGTLVFANSAFRAMFGISHADMASLNVATLFENPADRDTLLAQLQREGIAVDLEFRYRYSGGVGCALEHAALVEFEGEPAIVAWMVDITARKEGEDALRRARETVAAHRDALARDVAARTAELEQAKEAAEAASRAKSEFLANMSHELRTPLNAIIGFAQLMETDLLGPSGTGNYRDYAASITRSGGHLLGVIDDILDMARIDAGRMTLTEERVDLAACVERAVALTAPPPRADTPTVVIDLPPRLPAVRGDRRRVEQILVKLLGNAVRFTPGPGTVTVGVRRTVEGGLSLIVADTGIGMRADQIERALEPFQQVESGLGRRYEGIGLGLPIARGLAEMHGARLTLTSRSNSGTEAAVSFPPDRVLEPHAVAAPVPATPAAAERA